MDENVQKHLAFTTTVEVGSLTRAGELLGYSQSAVSRMISDLEREWGLAILRRDRAGVRLTAEGAELLPASRALVASWRSLREHVNEVRGLATGTVRIGTISSIATHRLPAIIAAFRADFPGIDYELLLGDYTQIETWLKEGRVDCGFVRSPADRALACEPFERDELMAVLPENHPLATCKAVPLEAFCEEPFLALEHGADTEVAKLFADAGLTPHVDLATWDDYAVMAMVERGLGLAILPSLILQRIPYRVVCRPLTKPHFRQLAFATRADMEPSLPVKKFREYLSVR